MLDERSDIDLLRTHYCYQLGSTFVNLALMETTIIDAMTMCDRIKVKSILGADTPVWERMKEKQDALNSSTLGSLITILSRHDISAADLAYLRWVKEKRDFFIHRFFHSHFWPGEMREEAIGVLCRRLLYLEAIFSRASHRIWKIFRDAGFYVHVDLGAAGSLYMPPVSSQKIASDSSHYFRCRSGCAGRALSCSARPNHSSPEARSVSAHSGDMG